jgi:hypothetical protein
MYMGADTDRDVGGGVLAGSQPSILDPAQQCRQQRSEFI